MIDLELCVRRVLNIVLAQQHHGVDHIFPVDLSDLQLLEQKIDEREGRVVELQPPSQVDFMGEVEYVIEDIGMPRVIPVKEDRASQARYCLDAHVLHVTQVLEQLLHVVPLGEIGHEVDIGEEPI